jgi:hypothetical protein
MSLLLKNLIIRVIFLFFIMNSNIYDIFYNICRILHIFFLFSSTILKNNTFLAIIFVLNSSFDVRDKIDF